MTSNDPRRKAPESVSELLPPPPPPVPTGSVMPNGQFDTIDAGKLIGKALANELGETLPPLIADATARALARVLIPAFSQASPQPRMCATCLAKRIPWEKANRAAVETAMTAAQTAAANGEPADFALYLPERLREAGVPPVNLAVTTEQGTDKCAEHITGVQGGSAPLPVATANVPPGALTK